jgi:GntR family transcriptional regulator, transcriptional repressor for pyruvate dehydrogenase complex
LTSAAPGTSSITRWICPATFRSVDKSSPKTLTATSLRTPNGDLQVQTQFDIQLHIAIAQASRNPMFTLLISSFKLIMEQTCPIGWRSRQTQAERLEIFDQHERIAAAIAAQDPRIFAALR